MSEKRVGPSRTAIRRLLMAMLLISMLGVSLIGQKSDTGPPGLILGNWVDDYGIEYEISKDTWFQKPGNKYDVVKWDDKKQYMIAYNEDENVAHGGLWTRIDWMKLEKMAPYEWAFCITEYKAKTRAEAEGNWSADRSKPKEGCNGFPFSRMKRIQDN